MDLLDNFLDELFSTYTKNYFSLLLNIKDIFHELKKHLKTDL